MKAHHKPTIEDYIKDLEARNSGDELKLRAGSFEITALSTKDETPYQVFSEEIIGWEIDNDNLKIKFVPLFGKMLSTLNSAYKVDKFEITFHDKNGNVTDTLAMTVEHHGISLKDSHGNTGLLTMSMNYKILSF